MLFEYDLRGRAIASQLQIGTPSSWGITTALPTYQMTTAYNDANQVTTAQTSAGGVVGYATTQQYETPSGYLKGLANTAGSTLATLNYQAQGLLDSISFQTNTNTALATDQFSYDNDLRAIGNAATWQSGSGASGTIVSQTRSYDPASNVTSIATTQAAVPGQSSSGGSEVQNFCYDEQNRLVWAGNSGTQPSAGSGTCGHGTLANGLSGGTESAPYAYTHLGQLWQGHLNGGATTQQYLYCDSTHPHQLTGLYPSGATCSSKGTAVYTSSYDAWGNVTSRFYAGTTATLSYDALDHFTQWNAGSTNQEWYVYDSAGNRVLKRTTSLSGTSLTTFPFGGIEEHVFTSTGTANGGDHYYYSLGGQLIGELNGTATQFFILDGLGSPLSSISNTGSAAIQGNQLFDPYGYRRYHSGTVGTSKQFTGQYNDSQTGLNYFNARYYDSIAGVFLSADSVQGNAQGMNPYGYVGGNPETKNDPTGHEIACDTTCASAVLAAGELTGLSFAELGPLDLLAIGVATLGTAAVYIATHQNSSQDALTSTSTVNAYTPASIAGIPDHPSAWDDAEQQAIALDAQARGQNARTGAIAQYQQDQANGVAVNQQEDPSQANIAVAYLSIWDSSGQSTNAFNFAFGYQGALKEMHAEPQLVTWAKGLISAATVSRQVTVVNLLIWTGKTPCKQSCHGLLFQNTWLKALWNTLGYDPGTAWVHFHVWAGGIPGYPFGLRYSRSYNGSTLIQRK